MTRAAANQIDSDAAHSPPPFSTVLALEPSLHLENYFIWDRIQENGTRPFHRQLARAAEAAAEALPAPTTDRQRVLFGRIQSLGTKTSERASASLRFANAQVAALTAQMEARRKAATR